jgi:hypothetical protein
MTMPPTEEASGRRSIRVIAGEGMLIAKVDGTYTDEFGRHEIKAGITRVAPDHPLARRRPEAFSVAWREDGRTAEKHRDNLRARMAELHGEERSQAKPTTRPAWWIG